MHTYKNGMKFDSLYLEEDYNREYHEPVEEEVFKKAINRVPKNGTFVNIGGAFGYYPILARLDRKDINIHVYEPLAKYKEAIKRNMSINGIEKKKIKIHSKVVSNKTGKLIFKTKGLGSSITESSQSNVPKIRNIKSLINAIIGLGERMYGKLNDIIKKRNIEGSNYSELSSVESVCFNDILKECGNSLHLVQMDVQGAEVNILQSAEEAMQRGLVESFLIGTHGFYEHRECRNILRFCKYSIKVDEINPDNQPDGIILAQKR